MTPPPPPPPPPPPHPPTPILFFKVTFVLTFFFKGGCNARLMKAVGWIRDCKLSFQNRVQWQHDQIQHNLRK